MRFDFSALNIVVMELNTDESDLRPVLLTVLATGMRKSEVARQLGISRALISEVTREGKHGWRPRYGVASKLLRLRDERCGTVAQEPAHA